MWHCIIQLEDNVILWKVEKMLRVGGDGEDDDFTSNSCSNPWDAACCKEIKITNAMRTGCNTNGIWLSMDESHIVHVNHGTLRWTLRRYSKVIGIGLAPSEIKQGQPATRTTKYRERNTKTCTCRKCCPPSGKLIPDTLGFPPSSFVMSHIENFEPYVAPILNYQ